MSDEEFTSSIEILMMRMRMRMMKDEVSYDTKSTEV